MRATFLPKKSFVKNTGDFSFFVNDNGVISTEGIPTCSCLTSNLKLFLNGVIYNKSENQLIQEFDEKGIGMVEELEGNFILFVSIKTEFYIVTDKVNSKKAFYAHLDDGWYISNNINLLPKQRCAVSQEGLACFLANGVMLNTLTLYKEIISARGGSIYTFQNQQLSLRAYWEYGFDYTTEIPTADSVLKLEKELEKLLIESVKEMAPAVSHAAVSLSAGYDIRGILGIIKKHTNLSDLACFSYASNGNTKEHSDSFLAKKIAEACCHTHEIMPFYNGDLVGHILGNAKQGKVLTNFCDELETWNSLVKRNTYTDLIVGEECFGYFNVPLESKEKLFSLMAINGAGSLRWLENFIDPALYHQFNNDLINLQNKIWARLDKFSDVHDKKDYLYFDQRINHVLLPWRENICSNVGYVHNPLMHSKILEFIKKLPPVHRQNKNLYKRTISKMLPELFEIGFATTSGYSINWELEIRKNKTKLIDFVERTDSLLDAIIPKEEIIKMIKKQSSFFQIASKNITRVILYFRKNNKLFNTVVTPFFGQLSGPLSSKFVFLDFLVIRLIIIRTELQQDNDTYSK